MEARDASEGMVGQLPTRCAAGQMPQLIRQGKIADHCGTHPPVAESRKSGSSGGAGAATASSARDLSAPSWRGPPRGGEGQRAWAQIDYHHRWPLFSPAWCTPPVLLAAAGLAAPPSPSPVWSGRGGGDASEERERESTFLTHLSPPRQNDCNTTSKFHSWYTKSGSLLK
jgi:hypothetical protein